MDDTAKNEHFVELKLEIARTLSEDLSEGRFSSMVDHFSHLGLADFAEMERIIKNKDVHLLLKTLEAQNQLSPDCVDNLEILTKLADNPLATELVKQYKCYEKIDSPSANVPNFGRSISTPAPTSHNSLDKNCNKQAIYSSTGNVDALPVPFTPTEVKPKKMVSEQRRMSFSKERQAAIDYAVDRLDSRKWQDVAFKLDILGNRQLLNAELECIDSEQRYCKDKIRQMFKLWVEDRGHEATVGALIGALKKARNVALAEDLEDGLHLRNLEYVDDNEPEGTLLSLREPVEG